MEFETSSHDHIVKVPLLCLFKIFCITFNVVCYISVCKVSKIKVHNKWNYCLSVVICHVTNFHNSNLSSRYPVFIGCPQIKSACREDAVLCTARANPVCMHFKKMKTRWN